MRHTSGVDSEMKIVTFIAAASVISPVCVFRRHPVSITDHAKAQRERISGADAEQAEMGRG